MFLLVISIVIIFPSILETLGNGTVDEKLESVWTKMESLEKTCHMKDMEIEKLIIENSSLKERVDSLEEKVDRKDDGPSAFSVGFLTEPFTCDTGHVLQYPDVITNDGGDFNPQTGKYICPVTGLYMFHGTFLSQRKNFGRIAIMVGGQQPAPSIYVDGRSSSEPGTWAQSAAMVLVDCSAGTKVWTECASSPDTAIYAENEIHYNVFSGVLLHAK